LSAAAAVLALFFFACPAAVPDGSVDAEAAWPRGPGVQEEASSPRSRPVQALPATTALGESPRATVARPDLPALLAAPPQALRASLQAALNDRAAGGRLYARALARRCAALQALEAQEAASEQGPVPLDLNDPAVQEAIAQRSAWASGCAQLLPDEELALASVPAGENGPADPLLDVLESEPSRARLAAVLARPDPLLLDELGPDLLGAAPRVGPQRFVTESDLELLGAALRLLPCEFGLACDGRDPAVWLACLRGEGCFGSRAEQVTAELADPQRTAAAIALRDSLRDAIRTKAIDRLLPG
jgi:hypothetical protein